MLEVPLSNAPVFSEKIKCVSNISNCGGSSKAIARSQQSLQHSSSCGLQSKTSKQSGAMVAQTG